MESQDNEKEYRRKILESFGKEWATADREKRLELNKRMNRWQELMKSGVSASQAYNQVMGEESDETVQRFPVEKQRYERMSSMNAIRRFLGGLRSGSFFVGVGAFMILFNIVQFVVPAVAGLSMIWWAITLFLEGSIIWGLLVLLIGTPIAIGIASYAAIFLLFIGIITLIIWGIINLFGFSASFGSVWSIVWLSIKILFLGGIAFIVGSSFVEAVKGKELISFFKGNWFWVILFLFLLWLFF